MSDMPPLTDVEVRQAFANIGLQIPVDRSPDTVQAFYRILWNSGFFRLRRLRVLFLHRHRRSM